MKKTLKVALMLTGLACTAPACAQTVVDQNGNATENAAAANANTTRPSARHRHRATVSPDNNSSVEASKSGGTVGALKNDEATGTSPAAHH